MPERIAGPGRAEGQSPPSGSSRTANGDTDKGSESRRSVFLILGGIIAVGVVAGYSWLRGLPKDK